MADKVTTYTSCLKIRQAQNRIINGTFDADLHWAKSDPSWTITGGTAQCDGSQAAAETITQSNAVASGEVCELTYTLTRSAGTITPKIGGTSGTARSVGGTFTETIVSAGADVVFEADSIFVGAVDAVEVHILQGITDLDQDLTIDKVPYKSAAGYSPTEYTTDNQLSVNNADLEGILSTLGVTRADIQNGTYDYAQIIWFLYDYVAGSTIKTIAKGQWGEAHLHQGRFVAEVRSLAQHLQQTIGEVLTPTCRADLGDSRCTIPLSTHTVTGTLTGVTSNRVFADSGRSEADDFFNYGKFHWTSGNNRGASMEVRDFANASGTFTLFDSMSGTVQVGDTYSVHRGCDKLLATCRDTYNNVVNFRGEPEIPGQDELVKFAGQQ